MPLMLFKFSSVQWKMNFLMQRQLNKANMASFLQKAMECTWTSSVAAAGLHLQVPQFITD